MDARVTSTGTPGAAGSEHLGSPGAPSAADSVASLVELLRRRAAQQPERVGYVFLGDDGRKEHPLTYGALDRQARAIAGQLANIGVTQDERVLLLFPPGEHFLAAFFGCLYAGAVAVPAFPPNPFQLGRARPRLLAVTADATPAAALTVAPLRGYVQELLNEHPHADAMRLIAIEEAPAEAAGAWVVPRATASATAMLQYTSGSTGAPKGVVLSHANLLHNLGLIQESRRALRGRDVVGTRGCPQAGPCAAAVGARTPRRRAGPGCRRRQRPRERHRAGPRARLRGAPVRPERPRTRGDHDRRGARALPHSDAGRRSRPSWRAVRRSSQRSGSRRGTTQPDRRRRGNG
jgi:non-ribosomal peptide synthetase component F